MLCDVQGVLRLWMYRLTLPSIEVILATFNDAEQLIYNKNRKKSDHHNSSSSNYYRCSDVDRFRNACQNIQTLHL